MDIMHIQSGSPPLWLNFPSFSKKLSWRNEECRCWERLPLLPPRPLLASVSTPRRWQNPRNIPSSDRSGLKGSHGCSPLRLITDHPTVELCVKKVYNCISAMDTCAVLLSPPPPLWCRPSHLQPHLLRYCQIWRSCDNRWSMGIVHLSDSEYDKVQGRD